MSASDQQLRQEANEVMQKADCLHDAAAVNAALDRLAEKLNQKLADVNPVVLCVMNGGLIISGQLLPRMPIQMQFDYIHATRYREQTSGGQLEWKRHHEIALKDRVVVILDDILDEGETLKSIHDACLAEGASEVIRVVLVEKVHERNIGITAEYVGLKVPDRYVFGYGMDYKGYWRNADGIYAVADE